MINKVHSKEEFFLKQLEELRDKGFDTSEDSNIFQILSSIVSQGFNDSKDISELLSKFSFDNYSGKELDNLYNFFGIKRLIKKEKSSSIKIRNSSDYYLLFNYGTLIEYNNKTYRVVTNQRVNPRKEVQEISLVPSNKKINKNYIEINDFKITLDNIDIITNSNVVIKEEFNKELFFKRNILISDFKLIFDSESDLDFSNRAKGLIQNFGDSNITKIKNYISGLDNVSEVKVKKEFNRQNVVIIPTEIRFIDGIMAQAQEVVDYYFSSPIVLSRPSITEIKIRGVEEQLNYNEKPLYILEQLKNKIKFELIDYLRRVMMTDEKIIDRTDIEVILNKCFIETEINEPLDEEKVKIDYFVFAGEDYDNYLLTNELKRREKKDIKTDVVIIGDVE